MNEISNDDVELLIEKVLEIFPGVFSYLMGKKINIKLTASSDEKEKYVEKTKMYIEKMGEMNLQLSQMKKNEDSPEEIFTVFLSKMDVIQHFINPEIRINQHFVDYYIDLYTKLLKEASDIEFLEATKYPKYKNLLNQLLVEGIRSSKNESVDNFFKQIDETEDPIIFAQALNIRLIHDYEFLNKKRTRLSKRTAMRFIKIYGELAGHYEKMISYVLGLIEIANNNIPDYSTLRKDNLSKKYWSVKKDKKYHELTSAFDPIIRNSIAHSNFTFLPIEKKIKFMDRSGKTELTYSEFEKKVKEFGALVLAVSQIRTIHILIVYHQFKDFLIKQKQS